MKHTVIVVIDDALVTMMKTQEELAELLKDDSVELISVNADKPTYRRKKRKGVKDTK